MQNTHTANVSIDPLGVGIPHVCTASQSYHRRGNDGDEAHVLGVDRDLHSDNVLDAGVPR